MPHSANKQRCDWANRNALEQVYHDEQWGVVTHDDALLFEMLVLETMQTGLSWTTIINKREAMRLAFDGFNPDKILKYTSEKIDLLMLNENIIRHRLKLEAMVTNAKSFIKIQDEFGSFDTYLWSFTNDEVIKNSYTSLSEIPSKTPLSEKLSKDLKKRGFKFVGPVVMYAYCQAIGMVNDHLVLCYRYHEV